jgi:hypothetical protein
MAIPAVIRGALVAREIDDTDVYSQLSVPVLATHGRDDIIVLPSMTEHLLRHCSTAVGSWYDGVGHMAFIEEPERFNLELGAFVDRARQWPRGRTSRAHPLRIPASKQAGPRIAGSAGRSIDGPFSRQTQDRRLLCFREPEPPGRRSGARSGRFGRVCGRSARPAYHSCGNRPIRVSQSGRLAAALRPREILDATAVTSYCLCDRAGPGRHPRERPFCSRATRGPLRYRFPDWSQRASGADTRSLYAAVASGVWSTYTARWRTREVCATSAGCSG